jgi:large subunit ribosomal protein L10
VFNDTGLVVVAHNTGMVAAQSAEFRRVVKEAGGTVKVAKNKLVQLAIKDTPTADISDLLKGPTVLAFSKDPIAAAKATVAYAKGNDKLVILGGAMGKTALDPNGVKALASLPSLDELRAKIVGLSQIRRRQERAPHEVQPVLPEVQFVAHKEAGRTKHAA